MTVGGGEGREDDDRKRRARREWEEGATQGYTQGGSRHNRARDTANRDDAGAGVVRESQVHARRASPPKTSVNRLASAGQRLVALWLTPLETSRPREISLKARLWLILYVMGQNISIILGEVMLVGTCEHFYVILFYVPRGSAR